jgi:N-methylhydantoinase A
MAEPVSDTKNPSLRMGVDIGGTFTDIVLERVGADGEAGEMEQYSTKILTSYGAPEDAILDGMHQVCALAGCVPADIQQVIHGTTLATNALIERSGAKTALITTKGFRDVIEMRTESRFEQYDLNLILPEPLLPRQQRYTVNERVDAQGSVLVPLDAKEVEALAERLIIAGYDSIAIGLIHGYANNVHERMIADILARKMPDAMLSLSSEVSPQMREYERFNTTVANAYIKPQMKSYLGRLKARFADNGMTGSIFMMHSGGGIMALDDAAEFPVRLVESGPAGGAIFAADIAARHDLGRVLSFDMGGTTAKICLIRDQQPKTARVFEVARSYRFKKGSGMPISIPVIDMVEIGAGGGSLAHVDGMNQIRVGPQSAGSEPGPACYGRGGARPAVTDADLLLGKLDADNFAGGSIVLDAKAAGKAMDSEIGTQLAMDAVTAAFGVAEMVDENMANAARVHAVENGEDLADYTMIAFGGAAPLHAGRLCEKLGVGRLIIPPSAGVGSAVGFLRAPFGFEATRSIYMRLSDFDAQTVKTLFAELEEEARNFVRSCDVDADIISQCRAYMRYVGQGWEIPVPLSPDQIAAPDAAQYKAVFEAEYSNLFGRPVDGMDVEITIWSVNAQTPKAQNIKTLSAKEMAQQMPDMPASIAAKAAAERLLFDAALGKNMQAKIYHRSALKAGQQLAGPAIIAEDETTIIIPASRSALCLEDGCIAVTLKEQQP